MDKKKIISIIVIGIVLIIGAISAFMLLGGKEEVKDTSDKNEGVVVKTDEKDRDEDEIKDDFDKVVKKERGEVGIIHLPEEDEVNKDNQIVSDVKEEVVDGKSQITANTSNGNKITIVGPKTDLSNKVATNSVPSNNQPKVHENTDSKISAEKMKPHVNELAKKVENIYKGSTLVIYSEEDKNRFTVSNGKEVQSYYNDGMMNYFNISDNNSESNIKLGVKAAIKLGVKNSEEELMDAVIKMNKPGTVGPISVGDTLVDYSFGRLVIKW